MPLVCALRQETREDARVRIRAEVAMQLEQRHVKPGQPRIDPRDSAIWRNLGNGAYQRMQLPPDC
jgi:hypothetical protein